MARDRVYRFDPNFFPIPATSPVLAGADEYDEAVAQGDGLLNHDLDPTDPHTRGPQDACGVFGVWAPHEEVAKLTYFGLYALQHRGQESAGIAVSKGSQIVVFKDMGLVSQVFNEATLDSLGNAHLAIGHCRYSTTGASVWKNAQPTFRSTADRQYCARSQRQPDQFLGTAELAPRA